MHSETACYADIASPQVDLLDSVGSSVHVGEAFEVLEGGHVGFESDKRLAELELLAFHLIVIFAPHHY